MSIQILVSERGLPWLRASPVAAPPPRAQSVLIFFSELPPATPGAAHGAFFKAPAALPSEPLSPWLSPLARRNMQAMPVLREDEDYRRVARQTFSRARRGQRPGQANVVQFSEGHHNMAGVTLFEQMLHAAREPVNAELKARTVLFEFRRGQEQICLQHMHQVDAEIAATPGGAVEYFRKLPADKLQFNRAVYMLSLALRLGFKVEFMDLDTDLSNHEARNYTMNQHIRRATAGGEGVILVNGAMHVGPMQTMLLHGQDQRCGPAVHAPVNMVSVSMVDDLFPTATSELIEQYLAHRLPAGRSQLVRAPRGSEREYRPSLSSAASAAG